MRNYLLPQDWKIAQYGALTFAGFLALAVMTACSAAVSGGSCAEECPAGTVCVEGQCAILCSVDADCATGCCSEQMTCVAECSIVSPEIHSVNGNGPADTDPSTAANRVRDRIVVSGTGLRGSTVQMQGGSLPAQELELCGTPSNESLVARLPDGITAGQYTLTVTNQAGSCSTELSLLRGEQGVAGANGAPGEKGDPGTVYSAGAGLVLSGDELSVDQGFVVQAVEDVVGDHLFNSVFLVRGGDTPSVNGAALTAALASVGTRSATNAALLLIEPGEYQVGDLTVGPHVHLRGFGPLATRVTGRVLLSGTGDTEISQLRIAPSTAVPAVQVSNGRNVLMRDVHLVASGVGLFVADAKVRLRGFEITVQGTSNPMGVQLNHSSSQAELDNGTITVDLTVASGNAYGIAVAPAAQLHAFAVQVTASAGAGGSPNITALVSNGGHVTVRSSALTAVNGISRALTTNGTATLYDTLVVSDSTIPSVNAVDNAGILNLHRSTIMAKAGTSSTGLFNNSGTVALRHPTIEVKPAGTGINNAGGSAAVWHAIIDANTSHSGTITCAYSANASGASICPP